MFPQKLKIRRRGYLLLVPYTADINLKNSDGWTALHYAAANGQDNIAKFLIDHGVDLNATNEDGWTALHLLARNGHYSTVYTLLINSANPLIKNIV